MGAVAVDFHDTPQAVTDDVMRYSPVSFNL